MAIFQPLHTDSLSSPDHSFLHRVVGIDSAATAHAIDINADEEVIVASNILATADNSQDIGNISKGFRRGYINGLHIGTYSTTTGFTITDTDGNLLIEVTTGATIATITLPTLADNLGRELIVKKIDAGAASVFLDGEGAETIDGSATYEIDSQYGVINIIGGTSSWRKVSETGGIPSGTKMLFKQATAPTGWTIDNTGLTDASGREVMVCAVHNNQYGADGGSQDPTNMTTPAQELDNGTSTGSQALSSRIMKRSGELVATAAGGETLNVANYTVNAVTLTPYYTHTIVATKD